MSTRVRKARVRKRSEVWQIIYMDLMTIVMVFFVILWSINQNKNEGITDTVGDQSANMVSLPSDVLFAPGKARLTSQGRGVFATLFAEDTESVLSFDSGGLTKRSLVIHGHTDNDGEKERNIQLAFERAYAAYEAIRAYSPELADHVTLCSHADNSPAQQTPQFQGEITEAQKAALKEAKAKNRRITIEDKIVSLVDEEP